MKYWMPIIGLALAASALLLYVIPAFASVVVAPSLSISPVPYTFNVSVGWDAKTDAVVAGFNIYCDGKQFKVPGRSTTSLTISNLNGPGNHAFTATTYSASSESSNCDEVDCYEPVKNMIITGTNTNFMIMRTRDFKSWMSIPSSTVTNDGGYWFYHATEQWP